MEVAAAHLSDIQSSSQATGLFKGWRDINVAAEIGGTITHVAVEEGSRVKQGQLLVELDHVQLDAQAASTQAQLDGARAQLALTKSATRPQQLAQAEAALSQAQATLDLAQKNYRRQQELYAAGVISKSVLDAAELQLKQAQAGFDAAQEQVSLAKEGARVEDIQAAEAAVRGLEAALVIAKENQRKAFVKAPFAGKVTKVIPEEHEMVAPGTVLLGLVDDSVMELTVGVNAEVVAKLRIGAPVQVAVEALGEEVRGTVSAIGVKGDDVTGTFPVKLAVANKTGRVLSGMVGNATLPLVTKHGVLVLPREVVLFQKDGTYVMVVEQGPQGSIARSRKVELGLDAGSFVEVKSGLKVGDQVIVTGMKNAYDGDPVKVTATREMALPDATADGSP